MKILFLFISLIFIYSCNNKKVSQINNDSIIEIFPESPIHGKDIKISYNPNNNKSLFKTHDTLFANIKAYSKYDTKNIRIKLSKSDDNFYCNFTVPFGIHTLDIMITPKNTYKSKEGITTVVFDENQKPNKGAFPFFIMMSDSFNEAKEYYDSDKEIYPNDFSRDGALWFMMLKNNQNTEIIKLKADTLLNYTLNNIDVIEHEDFLSAIHSCITVYNELQDWNKCKQLIQLLINNKGQLTNDLYHYSLSNLIRSYFMYNLKNDSKFSELLIDLIETDSTLILNSNYLQYAVDSGDLEVNPRVEANTLNKLKESLHSNRIPSDFALTFSTVYQFNRILFPNSKYSDIIDITELTLNRFAGYFSKNHWDNYNIDAPVGPIEGQKGILFDDLLDAYLLNKDTVQAISTIKKYIDSEKKITEFNKGSLSRSAIKLFDIYHKQNNDYEAKKSLEIAIRYDSPYVEDRYKKLQQLLVQLNFDTLDANFIKNSRFSHNEELSSEAMKHLNSLITKKNLNGSTVFIFLLDDTCPACNMGLGEALDTLKSIENLPYKIIVSSSKKLTDVQNLYGKEFIYDNNPTHFSSVFNINMLPSLIIIKNGKLLSKSSNITTNKAAYIEFLK